MYLRRAQNVAPGGREQASLLSKLLFNWIGPLVELAYVRPVEPENLYPLPSASRTALLLARFEGAWGEQLAKPTGERR